MAFRNVLLSTFCYHLDDGSDREDCRGGIKLSHFWANSLAISWILATAAVAALLAALWAARAASRLRTLSNASCVVPIPGALRLRTFKREWPRGKPLHLCLMFNSAVRTSKPHQVGPDAGQGRVVNVK